MLASTSPDWVSIVIAGAPAIVGAIFAGVAMLRSGRTNTSLAPPAGETRSAGELLAAGTHTLQNDVAPGVKAVAESAGVQIVSPPVLPGGVSMGSDGNS